MQLEVILNFLIGAIGAASTIFAYRFGKRKNKAEAQGNEIDNVERALKVYRDMLEDLKIRLDAQSITIEKQEKQILSLQAELRKLKKDCT